MIIMKFSNIDGIIKRNFPQDTITERILVKGYKGVGYSFLSFNFSLLRFRPSEFIVTNKHLFLDLRRYFLVNDLILAGLMPAGLLLFGYVDMLKVVSGLTFKYLVILFPIVLELMFLLVAPLLILNGLDGIFIFDRKSTDVRHEKGEVVLQGKNAYSLGVNLMTWKLSWYMKLTDVLTRIFGTKLDVRLQKV